MKLFELYLLLGKLYDCLRFQPKLANETHIVIAKLEKELSGLANDEDIAQDVEVELISSVEAALEIANALMEKTVSEKRENSELHLFHQLRDEMAAFCLGTNEQMRGQDCDNYFKTNFMMADALLEKNEQIDLSSLDRTQKIKEHRNALTPSVKTCQLFAEDIFQFIAFVKNQAMTEFVPLMSAVLENYRDKPIYHVALQEPQLTSHLHHLFTLPKHLSDCIETLSHLSPNFVYLAEHYNGPKETSEIIGSPLVLLKQFQQELNQLTYQQDALKLMVLIDKVLPDVEKQVISPLGFGLIGGESKSGVKKDLKTLKECRQELALLIMLKPQAFLTLETKFVDDLLHYKVKTPALMGKDNCRIKQLREQAKQLKESMNDFNRKNQKDALDKVDAASLSQSITPYNEGAIRDSEQSTQQVLAAIMPNGDNAELTQFAKNMMQDYHANRVAQQKIQSQLSYINQHDNLACFYQALCARFQSTLIGYIALSSGLVAGSQRGLAKVNTLAQFAEKLTGIGGIMFSALAAWGKFRNFHDSGKISMMGEVSTVVKSFETFARKLTIYYAKQLEIIKDGAVCNETALRKLKIIRFCNAPLNYAADYVVASIMMNLITADELPNLLDFPDKCWDFLIHDDLVKQEFENLLFDKLGFYRMKTTSGKKWHVIDMFRKPGLMIESPNGERYDCWGNQESLEQQEFGYRLSSIDEKNQHYPKFTILTTKVPTTAISSGNQVSIGNRLTIMPPPKDDSNVTKSAQHSSVRSSNINNLGQSFEHGVGF